jgi:F420-0:gamma-glutamyl ligase
MAMEFIPVKTRKFLPPKDDLNHLLDKSLPKLKEKDIVVITSKVVAISQGRTVPAKGMGQKIKLIKQEAEGYLPRQPHGLTIKDLALLPYAGIDRSNADNHYVLLPKKPHETAKKIWSYLKKQHQVKNLGVIIIDSFCLPLRWGHYGISIGFWGFHPNKSYVGAKDIFGNKIIAGVSNFVDGLSAIAGVLMGEGNEQTPLLIIRHAKFIKFTNKNTLKEIAIPGSGRPDFYTPLLRVFKSSSEA